MKKITILGAGPTGLIAAYYLSEKFQVTVIEKNDYIGGMSTSFFYKDFVLDYGPHKIYTQLPGILHEIEKVTNLSRIKKQNSIYLKGNFFDFPLKMAQVAFKMPLTAVSGVLDIIQNKLGKKTPSYLENRFGKTLYNLVFANYAEKIWGNPKGLDIELAKRRVSMSSFSELLKSVILKNSGKISADYFYYPEKGSFQLYEDLERKIKENKGKIILNAKIISLKAGKIFSVKTSKGTIKSDFLVSTIPLASLVNSLNAPREISEAASKLEYKDLNIIYFIINKPRVLKDNWIFFPEKQFLFNRISEQKSFSNLCCPKGKTVLMVETTSPVNDGIISQARKQLINLGLFSEQDIEETFTKKLEKAYPVYKINFKENLNLVLNYLDNFDNLISIGRHGLFNYNNIDQCWDMAQKASEFIITGKGKEDWKKVTREFDKYKIVD